MKLEDFPTDILKLLLNDQNSWAAIELWKCGNRTLNTRLANHGVTHIDLQDDMPSSKSRWPRCLKEFKLESLTISRPGGSLGNIDMLKSELKQLHAGLKNIEIHALSIGMCFFDETTEGTPNRSGGVHLFGDERDYQEDDDEDEENDDTDAHNDNDDEDGSGANENDESSNNDDVEPRPSKRSKTQEADHQDVPHTSMWNLELTWPHLERLELSDSIPSKMTRWDSPPGCFGSSVFAMLPRSLTWFGFHYAFTYECLMDLSALPNGLLTLRLPNDSINRIGLKTLPKSLTDLHHTLDKDEGLPLLLRKPSLLPNLKEFPFDWERSETRCWREVYEEDYSWPENISSMILSHDDCPMEFEKLPSKLTSLTVLGGEFDRPLTFENLAGLPRYLTSLELREIEWEGMNVKEWPSSLTKLTITSSCQFGAHCFQYLPRTLKEFETRKLRNGYDDDEEDLDEDLESICNDIDCLRTIGIDSLSLDEELWSAEKQRLLADGRQTYVQEIEDGGLFGLPLSLTKLTLASPSYPLTQTLLMPPHIHEIAGDALKFQVDDSTLFGAFDHIPAVSLHVELLSSEDEEVPPSVSALFMSNISSLSVTSHLEIYPLRYLPRGLRHLKWQSELIEDLDDLPPQLESLELKSQITQDSWVSHLPRTITSLTTSATIDGDDIQHLPPGLVSINAHFGQVTAAQLRQLPRTLCSFNDKLDPKEPLEASIAIHELIDHTNSAFRPFWRIWEVDEKRTQQLLQLSNEIEHPQSNDVDQRTVLRWTDSVQE